MNIHYLLLGGLCLLSSSGTAMAQSVPTEFELTRYEVANPDNTPRPVFPLPSRRQMLWNETEFYAFVHYGMDTYTGKERATALKTRRPSHPLACPTRHNGCAWPSRRA